MSRPAVVGLACVGAATLALGTLALLGSEPAASAGGWTGWTGRVDPSATADMAAMTPDDAVAVALLARSARTATKLAYSGRAETTQGEKRTTADLTHVPGRGTIVTAVSPTPGKAALAPDGRSGTLADDGRVLDLLRIHYRVLRQADLDEAVGGRAADAVVAVTADGSVAARFWLDHATGLLLRKQLLAPDGSVLRSISLTSVRLGLPKSTSIPATTNDRFGTRLDDKALAAERAQGCPCPDALPGGLALVETRRSTAGTVLAAPVVHQVFSDGLETVSLFSVAGLLTDTDASDLGARGFTAEGAGTGTAWVRAGDGSAWTAVWVTGGQVLTLVVSDAEDPASTASAVLQALPPSGEQDGSLLSRIARGWTRIFGGGS